MPPSTSQTDAMGRRTFIKSVAAAGAAGLLGATSAARSQSQPASRPNVLFIAVDDLNDWIAPLGGHPQVQTPNIDRIARRGFVFENASCPAPICTPARTAVMTGKQPYHSGLYFLQPLFRETPALRDAVTLPQHFRNHGYHAMAGGKVFHGKNDPASLDEAGGWEHSYGPTPEDKLSLPDGHPLWDWGAFPDDGRKTPDDLIADWGTERIARDYDRPFFLGVGFIRPHVPMYAPPEFFDLYPPGETIMPAEPERPVPINDYAQQLTHAAVAPRHERVLDVDQWEHAVRSYLASISYMDHQVGRLLDTLEASPHADNTIVVLWSDHGFHLGERQRWGKRSLWEESCRVPMLIAGPGVPHGRTDMPVSTSDLYPTLSDLAGLPAHPDLDGHSVVPLLDGRDNDWHHHALTTFGPGNHAVRSQHFRYIRYADGSEELYDHRADPSEWTNVAADPNYRDVVEQHRQSLPTDPVPLTAGSAGSDSPLFP